jgi:uncharacterized protein (DUF924 family)
MASREDGDALALLNFWLPAGPARWFARSDEFDAACARWVPLWERARDGGCIDWRETAAGSLALLVLLDQIPRNAFRGTAQQFATDDMALSEADRAVEAGHDRAYPMPLRNFFYLPYQHTEDITAQERGLDLYRAAGDADAYYWALVHADAIRRFGRFPHRNALLGRDTTEAEQNYLQTGGFGA